ncbi:hypothetical protein D3C77_801870 [compost metagenome]
MPAYSLLPGTKAREPTNRLMVKPMPQRIATPSTWPQLAPAGNAAMPALIITQAKPNTPRVLPTSRPTAMPMGT